MGFNFNNALSGVAKAGTSYFDGKTEERTKERDRTETDLYNSMSRIHTRASDVQSTRRSEQKRLKTIMNDFRSKDPTLTTDQLEYISQLGTGRLSALMSTASSPILTERGQTLSDVISLIDDPSELDDTGTLIDRVEGAVIPTPFDNSAYYSTSDILSNSDVDAMSTKMAKQFMNITGMTIEKAKGMSVMSLTEVQEQRYSVEYVEEDLREAQVFERAALDLTRVRIEGTRASKALGDDHAREMLMQVNAIAEVWAASGQFNPMGKAMEGESSADAAAISAGTPVDIESTQFQAAFRKTEDYRTVVTRLIKETVKTAMENEDLKTPYLTAINKAFPNVYLGEAGDDATTLVDFALYWAEGVAEDGTPQKEVMWGHEIKTAAGISVQHGKDGKLKPELLNPENNFLEKKDAYEENSGVPFDEEFEKTTIREDVATQLDTLLSDEEKEEKAAEDAQLAAIDARIKEIDSRVVAAKYKVAEAEGSGDPSVAADLKESLAELKEELLAGRIERDDMWMGSQYQRMQDFVPMVEEVVPPEGLMSRNNPPASQWMTQTRESMAALAEVRSRADRAIKSGDKGAIAMLIRQSTELAASKDLKFANRQQRELASIISQLKKANTSDGV